MYHFTPPTSNFRAGPRWDTLFGRVLNKRGQAVVLYSNGTIKTVDVIDPDAAMTTYFRGGCTHLIDDATAATLTAAGYGAYLTAVV